ncbi:hypothetical protein [Streptomyces melanogenes]|uniref:hypothetical protein n=1 Tax=Streptomyces melanogenes TaxID=67326 RepID=UPI00167E8746|nr:hypothetical protein [Streptomyces melanogenes]GGP93381.1 hypothetical protein GCM10010278_84260 [Streptomyces melanogenes]
MSSPVPPPPESPFISMHTAVILLTAIVIGLVIGGLTFLSDFSAPGAVLAGLGASGLSVPGLRQLIR